MKKWVPLLTILLVAVSLLAWGVCDSSCPSDLGECEEIPIGDGFEFQTYPHMCNSNTMTCWSYDPWRDSCQKFCWFNIHYCPDPFVPAWFRECTVVFATGETCLQE